MSRDFFTCTLAIIILMTLNWAVIERITFNLQGCRLCQTQNHQTCIYCSKFVPHYFVTRIKNLQLVNKALKCTLYESCEKKKNSVYIAHLKHDQNLGWCRKKKQNKTWKWLLREKCNGQGVFIHSCHDTAKAIVTTRVPNVGQR